MALVDHNKPLIPLSSIAELINAKQRTLKIYEDKGLLPDRHEHKFYTLNDVQKIAFVHYLASKHRINASGIRFINELLQNHFTDDQKQQLLNEMEKAFENTPSKEFMDVENL